VRRRALPGVEISAGRGVPFSADRAYLHDTVTPTQLEMHGTLEIVITASS